VIIFASLSKAIASPTVLPRALSSNSSSRNGGRAIIHEPLGAPASTNREVWFTGQGNQERRYILLDTSKAELFFKLVMEITQNIHNDIAQ
jgi:hypothetical protein